MTELIIDSFAGGGGTSTGIEMAIGRSPDIALNHDPAALAMHRANHPSTRHVEEDVVTVDSVGLCAGRPVGLFWLSPDCKHHSKAKGGKPREKNIRGLAWTGFSFVKSLPAWQRPRVVILENVEEFAHWGPLLDSGHPCPDRKGQTFKAFVSAWEGRMCGNSVSPVMSAALVRANYQPVKRRAVRRLADAPLLVAAE